MISTKSLNKLKELSYASVGSSRVSNYTFNNIEATSALFVFSIAFPDLIRYRGCVFIEFLFDPAIYDKWNAVFNGSIRDIEYSVNNLMLSDCFNLDDVGNEELKSIAECIQAGWNLTASKFISKPANIAIEFDDVGTPCIRMNSAI
jgi:hypothetical protein